jgi:hypothetical protein
MSPEEYETLRDRYSKIETWATLAAIAAAWIVLLMVIEEANSSPWLVGGCLFGWLVIAPVLLVAACTLPRGLNSWNEFWEFHEQRHRISIYLFTPLYSSLVILGIVSTIMLSTRH